MARDIRTEQENTKKKKVFMFAWYAAGEECADCDTRIMVDKLVDEARADTWKTPGPKGRVYAKGIQPIE